MQSMVMWNRVMSVNCIAFLCACLATTVAGGQIYLEDFSDYSADDLDNGYCEVRWCPGHEYANGYNCGSAGTLYFNSPSSDDIVWVHFGDRGCTSAELRFSYGQCAPYNAACLYPPYPTCYPTDDLADSTLKFKVSTNDSFSCNTIINTLAENLNLTWTTAPECYQVVHSVDLEPGDASVYWKFDKGTHDCSLVVDEIEIYLYGCECGPGECVTELSEDFGHGPLSGTVCDQFTETFEACEGSGPYTSRNTDCGGAVDGVMEFGSGIPYSAATLRCVDLSGESDASLTFNYAKNDGTLGPQLRVSLDGEEFPYPPLWLAPFSPGMGCHPVCVDLGDYAGESEVWLKFISGSSSPASAIDDIQLVLGEGCATCSNPSAFAGDDCLICPGTTRTLSGTASGGSGGLCPGDYSPSWQGPGIVSGGDTLTPTIDESGAYVLTVSCEACTDSDTVIVTEGGFGDWNNDGIVDLSDFAMFESCLTGPGGGLVRQDCQCGDYDDDWDVDLDDVASLFTTFND